jgi:hypothetical protein
MQQDIFNNIIKIILINLLMEIMTMIIIGIKIKIMIIKMKKYNKIIRLLTNIIKLKHLL